MTQAKTKDSGVEVKPNWKRMLTGDRPTGALHLGHYVGSLKMRVDLQDKIETFVLMADLHVLTTRTHDLEEIGHNIRECVLDYLSVGIDPQKTTIYLQSLVPEVLELFWLFMPLTSVPRAAHPDAKGAGPGPPARARRCFASVISCPPVGRHPDGQGRRRACRQGPGLPHRATARSRVASTRPTPRSCRSLTPTSHLC